MKGAIYNKYGEILRIIDAPTKAAINLQASSGEHVYLGEAEDTLHWIDNGEKKDKFKIKPTVVKNGLNLQLTNLPDNCFVSIENNQYEITDNEVEITFEQPGQYNVKITALHHIPWQQTVDIE